MSYLKIIKSMVLETNMRVKPQSIGNYMGWCCVGATATQIPKFEFFRGWISRSETTGKEKGVSCK